jgi:hypothetical protein
VGADVLDRDGDAGQDRAACVSHAADDVGGGDLGQRGGVQSQKDGDSGKHASSREHVLSFP